MTCFLLFFFLSSLCLCPSVVQSFGWIMSTKTDLQTLAPSEPLREQLLAAAKKFADDAHPLGQLLGSMIDDVQRATAEPLEIFPVCHHSPAAAVHMIRCLRE